MLGSCSKDDTEVTSVEVNGKIAFKASMQIGNATRTHLEETVPGTFDYAWDNGDMIGATINGGDEVIPFIASGSGTGEIGFGWEEADLDYLGVPPYYLVYPYDKDAKVDGYNVTMTIPSSQRYRENSFATMTAPAVQVIAEKEDDDIPSVKMRPVASYVRVPVVGAGKLTKLSMTIKDAEGKYYKLCGSASVNLKNIEKAVLAISGTDEEVSSVSVSWGNSGLDLKYAEAKNVWFIIPANTTLAGSYITFTAVVDGKESIVELPQIPTTTSTKTLPVNQTLPVPTISVGTENMVMINNTEDFLKYAYEVNLEKGSADADYISDGKFKTAVLLNSLSFRNYDAGQKYSENAALGAEKDVILEAALQAYMANGGFSSLKAGANIDGNGNTISYMTVNGNGIFAGQPDALKNLTLSAVTVNVPDEANPALFVGNINLASCSESLAIKGGYLKNVAEDATAALIHTAYLHTLPLKSQVTISYPRVNESSGAPAYYASKLTLREDVKDAKGDLKAYFNSATPRFGAIVVDGQDVAIRNVSSACVRGLLDAIQYGGGSKAISVIDSNGTSYWTGGVASAAPANGEVKTAEQLAYYVKNGGTATLAANIDLQGKLDKQGKQGKEWVLDNGSAPLNITGNGKYTISNALVKSQKVTEPYVAYSLLGNVVNAKDIVVDGVTIDVDNVEGSTAQLYVGGIGYQGSANGVKVSNLTIDIAEDVKVSMYNEVGGLISAPTAASEKNAVTDLSINVNGNETVGLVGGMFAKTSESFNENSLAYKAEAADKYAMIAAWTLSNNAVVSKCNADVAIVGDVNFAPTDAGQVISLTYDCLEPFCDYLVNTKDYNIGVDINGKVRSLKPGKNPFENEE